jgi:hypothetical protein
VDWRLVVDVSALIVSGANALVLLLIKLELSKMENKLMEWARDKFPSANETERRFQELREGLQNLEKRVAEAWQSGKHGGC